MYYQDPWPSMPDGTNFDGKQLLSLVRSGESPFEGALDVNLLIQELEENLDATVTDIPFVYTGSNNYGFHCRLSNGLDIVARLACGDVNMPDFDGFPIHVQIPETRFEAAVYELLSSEPNILTSRLLYYRVPMQRDGPRRDRPSDITGRRLLACLLAQSAHIRASLFNYEVPLDFAADWFLKRLFEQKPESLPTPVAPTREFCVALFTAKIEATIRNLGDPIAWEDDNEFVGPVAAAAKQSLLRLIPHIMPADGDQASLYRLVLDHGDFGIHNMSITMDPEGKPLVTSLYDWETGCIAPAILSDPLMAVSVDLVADENAMPSITRVPSDASSSERAQYMMHTKHYFEALFNQAPNYERAIQAGKDARHLWFALRDWRGADPEGFFGSLGSWAETRMKDLGVTSKETLSLDAASVTLRNASTGVTERVNIPPRSVTRGYYPNLTQMYDYLRIPLRSVRYTFLYAEIASSETRAEPRQPQSADPMAGAYFAFDNIYKPVLSARLNCGWLQQLCQVVFLAVCHAWFIAACFLVEPRVTGKTDTSESLQAYLRRTRVPQRFVDRHLLPVLGAICTCSHEQLLDFPASDVVNFMTRSSLQKTYMTDGVHDLQSRLAHGIKDIRLQARVRKVERAGNGVLVQWDQLRDGNGSTSEQVFDRVVLAVTPNAAAKLFAPASYVLSSIPTAHIEATVIDPSYKRVSVEERGTAPTGRLFSQNNHRQLMAFRTHFSEAVAQTEAWNYLPSGAICRTSPFPYTSDQGAVLHKAQFTRTLRTVESRSIVQRVVSQKSPVGGEAWVSGKDNVWVTGSWCWDGMVLLEGCVVSAMRVADEFGVGVPWRADA
ncbi:hypothetical protein V2A60_006375 [Cordyceps javanica]